MEEEVGDDSLYQIQIKPTYGFQIYVDFLASHATTNPVRRELAKEGEHRVEQRPKQT